MSIQSEITRISGNVSDALDAIEAKGVTIPSGSNSDDLADLISQIQGGGGAAITVTDTTDTHGGIIRTITAVDISNDTVTAAHLESGYTAHDAQGNAITGTLSPGGGGNWSWMGENPTKVKTYAGTKTYLKNTDFATWTPSTTRITLSSSSNLESYSVGGGYDYVMLLYWHTHLEYQNQPNSSINDLCYIDEKEIYLYPNDLGNMTSGTKNARTSSTIQSRALTTYKNNSGTNSLVITSSGYGVYPSPGSPSTSYSTITPKSPTIYAQCNSTYFTTDAAEAVNQDASYYEWTIELWQVDNGTAQVGAVIDELRDIWINGL